MKATYAQSPPPPAHESTGKAESTSCTGSKNMDMLWEASEKQKKRTGISCTKHVHR